MEDCNWKCTSKEGSRPYSDFRRLLIGHLQVKHGRQLDSIRCLHCSEKFKTRRESQLHFQAQHRRVVKCGDCPYVSRSLSALRAHRDAYHAKKTFECELCSFTCRWKASLRRHRSSIHGKGEKAHECKVCGKTFTQSGSVHRHMRVVHPQFQECMISEGLRLIVWSCGTLVVVLIVRCHNSTQSVG